MVDALRTEGPTFPSTTPLEVGIESVDVSRAEVAHLDVAEAGEDQAIEESPVLAQGRWRQIRIGNGLPPLDEVREGSLGDDVGSARLHEELGDDVLRESLVAVDGARQIALATLLIEPEIHARIPGVLASGLEAPSHRREASGMING
jgi:hypothetical protein